MRFYEAPWVLNQRIPPGALPCLLGHSARTRGREGALSPSGSTGEGLRQEQGRSRAHLSRDWLHQMA